MSTPRPAHVLLAEDEDDLAALVELNLELSGYRVTVARNGQQALDLVAEVEPDLVLLDVMMPIVDGWQVLHRLTADPATRDLPVVMLTALAEERDLIRGHLQGAVRYVTKPFEMAALMRTVEDALAPVDEQERARRHRHTVSLLQRLAELDSGRDSGGTSVHLSRLEHPREAPRGPAATPTADPEQFDRLTEQQRHVAERLAQGVGAREIASNLGVSRSNVYAVRKRVARRLGVTPEEVGPVIRELLEHR